MKKNILLLFLFCVASLSAQKLSVSGNIKDEKKPMQGVLVKSRLKQDSVSTNKRGNFHFKSLDEKDTLSAYIKGQTVLIPLNGNNTIQISIKRDTIFVDKSKKEATALTYGGTMLTREQLEKTGETDLLKAISMRVPGVEYSNGNLIIRGKNSIYMSSDPLYVINGVQTPDAAYLQVQDVDRVEVLKGAEAAIFGVKGAGGVIVITLR